MLMMCDGLLTVWRKFKAWIWRNGEVGEMHYVIDVVKW